MSKFFRYKNLTSVVADDEEVNFSIRFISDGNMSQTTVNIPGEPDPKIEDEGTVSLGVGRDLREDSTISVSFIQNPIPEEEDIVIEYSINGTPLVEHRNSKSESETPIIILFIKFPSQEVDE